MIGMDHISGPRLGLQQTASVDTAPPLQMGSSLFNGRSVGWVNDPKRCNLPEMTERLNLLQNLAPPEPPPSGSPIGERTCRMISPSQGLLDLQVALLRAMEADPA